MSDAGLQVERTSLAWRRTQASALLAGVLTVAHGVRHRVDPPWLLLMGTATVVVLLVALLRGRELSRSIPVPRESLGAAAGCALGTLLLTVAVSGSFVER